MIKKSALYETKTRRNGPFIVQMAVSPEFTPQNCSFEILNETTK